MEVLTSSLYKHKYKSNRLHVTNKLDERSEIFDEQRFTCSDRLSLSL